jgi:hypothetical protein
MSAAHESEGCVLNQPDLNHAPKFPGGALLSSVGTTAGR